MPVNAIAMPFSFAAALDSSSLMDPPRLETSVRLAHVSSPFGRGWVRVRSLNRQNRIYEAGVGVKRKVRKLWPGRQARVVAGDKLGDSSFVVTI